MATSDIELAPTPGARASSTVTPVAYETVDSPIGTLLLAATEEGLARLAFEGEGFDQVLETLSGRIGPTARGSSPVLDQTERELAEYFAGDRRRFGMPLDLRLSSGFRRTVQQFLPQIAYGHTLTYAQVAERVGNPGAVRAVGSACATNPLPVVVPCHRVLRSDGSLGGYAGGLEIKQQLLEAERRNLGAGRE